MGSKVMTHQKGPGELRRATARAVGIFTVEREAAGKAAKLSQRDSHTSSSFLQPPLASHCLSPVFTDHLLPGNPLISSLTLTLSNLLSSSPNKKDGLQPCGHRVACSSASLSTVWMSMKKDPQTQNNQSNRTPSHILNSRYI